MTSFAAAGSTIVAVGGSHAGGVWHPVFLRSRDDGRTWSAGRATPSAGAAAPTTADTADLVVRGRTGFLALGGSSGGVSAWTSADGARWSRHSIPRSVMGRATTVTGLAVTVSGYAVAGYTQAAGRRSAPLTWTSGDGVRWVRHAGASAGLPGVTGAELTMTGIAAARDGRHLVAVGALETDERSRERPAAWTSSDAGVHWARVALPATLAGTGTRTRFGNVERAGGEFVATGNGGSESVGNYAGVVATSPDGRTWHAMSSGAGLVAHGQVYLSTSVARAGGLYAFGRRCNGKCTPYGVARSGRSWRAARIPASGEGDDMDVTRALVTKAGTVLLAGSANPHGDSDARIWRSTTGSAFARAGLPDAGTHDSANVYPSAIANGDGRYVVVGTARGLPVVWTSTDSEHFGSPLALSRSEKVSVSTVDHGPAGWLATGSQAVGRNEQAVAWSSVDGAHWQQASSGTFGRAGDFAYNYISTAVGYRGWTVVGASSEDGYGFQSALVYRSVDGASWSGTHQGSRVYDLRGGVRGAREMNDVALDGSGVIAGGEAQRGNGAATYLPAIWTSPDSQSWRLHWLPLPRGAGSAYVREVAARDGTLVGFGVADHGGDTTLRAWNSTDSGGTWHVRALPGIGGADTEVDAAVLATTGHGFVAAGSSGAAGAARPLLWTSRDGAGWHRVHLTDRRLAQRGEWSILGLVVDGNTVRGLASKTTTAGVTSFTFSQRV